MLFWSSCFSLLNIRVVYWTLTLLSKFNACTPTSGTRKENHRLFTSTVGWKQRSQTIYAKNVSTLIKLIGAYFCFSNNAWLQFPQIIVLQSTVTIRSDRFDTFIPGNKLKDISCLKLCTAVKGWMLFTNSTALNICKDDCLV